MTQKKNGFWRLIFSLLPGAGEMYMGFMKMGVSLMTIFFGIIAVAAILEMGTLIFVSVIVWFYSFFHVHNLAGMPDEEFYALEDEYLFEFMEEKKLGINLVKTYHTAIAWILIVLGTIMLWRSFMQFFDRYLPNAVYWAIHEIGYSLPQIIVGVAIIILGVHMIRGKKIQLDQEDKLAIDVDVKSESTVEAERKEL